MGIGDVEQRARRRDQFARQQAHADDVVTARDRGQTGDRRIAGEVGQHEDHRATAQPAADGGEHRRQVRRSWPQRRLDDVAQHAQHVRRPLLRRHEPLVARHAGEQADAVVVVDRHAAKARSDARAELPQRPRADPRLHARAEILHEHQRALALLDEAFDERPAHARGDVPVDRARVVALDVLAHVAELDAAAAERRAEAAGQHVGDQPSGR